MIQDIAPHIFSNAYLPQAPQPENYILYFNEDSVLITGDDSQIRFPRFKEVEKLNPDIYANALFLFRVDNLVFYLTEELNYDPAIFRMAEIAVFRTARPRHLVFAGITGYGLFQWYSAHRFCGRCGELTVHAEKERMLHCPACGQMEYPKIAPAVIIAIVQGEKLLLSKYANRNSSRYALLAGFAEIGESIEETVRREVLEEVGLKVKNIRYYKSQPWAFSDSMLFGFFAELDGDPTITLDQEELEMADWIAREDIPEQESDISLTSEMIQLFKEQGSIVLSKG